MQTILNGTTNLPSSTVGRWIISLVIALLVVWTLGMMGVIHLPLALVWILPFACLVIGALAILWEGGAFHE